MLSARDILLGVLLPMVVSAAILLLAKALWKKTPLGGSLAIAAGFFTGYTLIFGPTQLPPLNAFEWIVPLAAAAAIIGSAAELARFRLPWLWGLLMPAIAWTIARPQYAPPTLICLGILGWVWWIAWDGVLAKDSPRAWPGMVMTGVAGFVSLVLMLSDSQKFGQMGLALVGATVGAWVVGWGISRGDRGGIWRGSGVAWGVILYGLLLNGRFWAGLTWTNAALLLAAPLMAWIGEIPGVSKLTGWKRSAVRIAAVIVPVAIAAALAAVEFQRAQESSGSEYY